MNSEEMKIFHGITFFNFIKSEEMKKFAFFTDVIATLIEMCHSSCHPIPLSSSLTCLYRQRTTISLMFQGIPWWRRFWDLGYQFRFGPELLPVSAAEWSRRWEHSVDTIANLEYFVYKVQLYGQSVPGSIPGQNISEKWKRQNILCKLLQH